MLWALAASGTVSAGQWDSSSLGCDAPRFLYGDPQGPSVGPRGQVADVDSIWKSALGGESRVGFFIQGMVQ